MYCQFSVYSDAVDTVQCGPVRNSQLVGLSVDLIKSKCDNGCRFGIFDARREKQLFCLQGMRFDCL